MMQLIRRLKQKRNARKAKIKELKKRLGQLNETKYYETTCPLGVAYHELPFTEFNNSVYRRDLKPRVDLIERFIRVRQRKGLDIGCAIGGISFELARRGALMLGVDFNPEEISIAQGLEDLQRTGCVFICQDAFETTNSASFLENFDFAVWYSQWMWFVKQHGIEKGKKALFNVSMHVDHLFFETSIGDAGAGGVMRAHGITSSSAVLQLLRENTAYTFFEECRRGDGSALNRSIFYCAKRQSRKLGQTASVTRINFDECEKDLSKRPELFSNEVAILKRIEGKHFPRILAVSDLQIRMNYCGTPLTLSNLPPDYVEQCREIVSDLKKCDVIHRDINPTNLLIRNGVIMLVDFGYAGRLSDPVSSTLPNDANKLPRVLGYASFRAEDRFNDELSLAKSIDFIKSNANWDQEWDPVQHLNFPDSNAF